MIEADLLDPKTGVEVVNMVDRPTCGRVTPQLERKVFPQHHTFLLINFRGSNIQSEESFIQSLKIKLEI